MKRHLIWYRVTSVFILLILCSFTAFAQKQTVTVRLKNASLKQLFNSIEKQTTYRFSYRNLVLDEVRDITVSKEKAPVTEVLDVVLSGRNLQYEIVSNKTIVVYDKKQINRPSGKKKTITGGVFDSNGVPLIGATIKMKNSSLGAITDINGEFQMVVPEGETLEFSYIGYITKNIKVAQQSKLNITLDENTQSLNEVVVTGFQTLSRERASGSFESVNKKILDKLPASNVSSILTGQMAGVDVDKDGNINIRGISYISKKYRSPLVVVDGFPIESGIESINPNNIESITVLKDAAAASIWGARSANGVIVVTTKEYKGDQGSLAVSFNAFTRIGSKIDLDYANPIADASNQLGLEKYLMGEYYKYDPSSIYEPSNLTQQNTIYQKTEGAYLYSMLNKGYLSAKEVEERVNQLRSVDYKDDVYKYLMRNPIYQQYNLSLRGNTKKSNFNFSILYDKNLSDFVGTDNDRVVADFKNNYKINKKISLYASVFLSINKNNNNGVSMGDIKSLASYDKLVNPDGSYNNHTADMNYGMRNYMNLMGFPYSWNSNLLQDMRDRDINSNTLQARLQGGIDVNIIDGLKFSSKYQYEKVRTSSTSYYGPETYMVRNLINTFAPIGEDRISVGTSYFPKGGIRNGIGTSNTDAYNFRNQLDYKKTFKDKHEVNAIIGTEIIENLYTSDSRPWEFGVNPNSNSIATLPDTRMIGTDFTGEQHSMPHSVKSSYGYQKRRYFSLYFNGSYTFNNKYTATFGVRTDASNIISSNPKYRYVPLWSAGLNWNAGDEEFIKSLSFIDRLNVRGSYGLNAQGAIGSTNATTISTGVGDQYNEYNVIGWIAQHGNPELRWEKTQSFNIGIDYSFFKGLLFGKLDFYNKKGIDLLYRKTLPSILGFGQSMNMNYAGVLNRGGELQVGTQLNLTKDISWTSEVNYSYNYNKITRLESGNTLVGSSVGTQTFFEGGSVSDYYAYKYDGYFDGVPYVVKKDGSHHPMNAPTPNMTNETAGILYNMGTTIAPHILGWTNTFKIKDLSVIVLLTGKFGHVFAKQPVFASANANSLNNYNKDLPNYIDNRWAKDFPGLINVTNLNQLRERRLYVSYLSSHVDDASFIRLNNIIFDYNLMNAINNVSWLKKIKGLNIYGEIKNIGLLWTANKWNMDPEFIEGSLKPQTMYTIGVKVNI